MVYVLFYDKYEKKYRLSTNRYSKSVDNIVLHDVTFFIAPETQHIIKIERTEKMSKFEAKFPHAFAIGTSKNSFLFFEENKDLDWQDFDYDVFKNDFFVLSKNTESLKGKDVEHLVVGKDNSGNMIRKLVIKK